MAFSKYDPALTMEKIQTMPEGQFFDRKSVRLAPKDLAHHLSAFANASGGLIALGLEDNGSITGVEKEEETRFVRLRLIFFERLQNSLLRASRVKLKKDPTVK